MRYDNGCMLLVMSILMLPLFKFHKLYPSQPVHVSTTVQKRQLQIRNDTS